jgi:hypothetical protein
MKPKVSALAEKKIRPKNSNLRSIVPNSWKKTNFAAEFAKAKEILYNFDVAA